MFYTVMRDAGWPIPPSPHDFSFDTSKIHAFGETFESDDEACEKAVEQGYLAIATTTADAQAPDGSSVVVGDAMGSAGEDAGVSIPLVITRKMRSALLAANFSEEQINAMTPQQAHDLLAKS